MAKGGLLMKGLGRKFTVGGGLAAVLAAAGCMHVDWKNSIDPCWPQRWITHAREEVMVPLHTQANNGLVLEQTVWSHHFKEATAELTPGGQAYLARLARRRPGPIPEIFLQTAQAPTDVKYVVDRPDQLPADRNELDGKRSKAITDYLAAVRPDVAFKVTVHNPSPVGMPAEEARDVIDRLYKGPGASSAGSLETTRAETQTQQQNINQDVGPNGGQGGNR
jgi:hypothetical protein